MAEQLYLGVDTMDNFPYFIPMISKYEHFFFNKFETISEYTWDYHLIICLQGNLECEVQCYGDRDYLHISLSKNEILTVAPELNYTISVTSEFAECLLICSHFYVGKNQLMPVDPFDLNAVQALFGHPVQHEVINVFLPQVVQIEEQGDLIFIIERIKQELDFVSSGRSTYIRSLVSLLIISLLRQRIAYNADLFSNIDQLVLESRANRNIPLPKGCEICIGNVSIIQKKTTKSKKEKNNLTTFQAQEFEVNYPNSGELVCERIDNPGDPLVDKYLKIVAHQETNYNINFKIAKDCVTDLTQIQQVGYIHCYVKTNQACSFGMHLINTLTKRVLPITVYVSTPNVWQSIDIPLLKPNVSSSISLYVLRTVEYIKSNYFSDMQLRDIAELLHITPSYLSKLFYREMGSSYLEYLTKYRINQAKILLKKTDKSVEAIAKQVGFYDLSHFCRTFKKLETVTPTKYRQS